MTATDAAPRLRRTTYAIAAGSGIASLAMNFWLPLLPLYMQQLGASTQANALFWTAIANVALGLARIVSGPVWGAVSDRIGRKPMFVRTLLFASATIVLVGFAREPWHVVVAFAVQGLFSGFTPAATALMSVSTPEERMSSSLSIVTGGQYLGTTAGPALGAALVVLVGFRGSMFAGALLPIIAATVVQVLVPRDAVRPRVPRDERTEAPSALWRTLPAQFYLAVFLFFLLFGMNQVVRLLTPIALQGIEGTDSVAGISGVAFSAGGLAAVLGIVLIARSFVRPGRLKGALIAGTLAAGAANLLLATTHGAAEYIVLFSIFSLVHASMIPAANTLIAMNVARDRRGTGFGIASSAQAVALMVGPMAATVFGASSIALGFATMAVLFAAIAALVFAGVREPRRGAG
ncbi:MAG: MFS transporter [Dehalococcoidia bacterium]